MKLVEHKFTLDVNQTASQVSISVKKGDTARRLLIHLAESGFPYHMTRDCYAVFSATKPDGHVIFNNCSIENCVIGYDFTEQTVAAVGLMACEIIVYGARGRQLTSASFDIIVEESNAALESSDEANALGSLISAVKAATNRGLMAPAIVCRAEGETISLTDASDEAMQGLRIFGNTTQGAVPTLDSPVELVSIGAKGSIAAKILGKNIISDLEYSSASHDYGTLVASGDTSAVKKGKQYTISVTLTAAKDTTAYWNSAAGFFANSEQFVVSAGTKRYSKTFTAIADGNTGKERIFVSKASSGDGVAIKPADFQIELGAVATDYENTEQSVTITSMDGLPGVPMSRMGVHPDSYTGSDGKCWLGDEVDLKRGVRVNRIGTITGADMLRGFVALNQESDNYNQYTINSVLGAVVPGVDNSASTSSPYKALCNCLPLGGQVNAGTKEDSFWIYSLNVIVLVLNKTDFPDVESVEMWLSNNNVEIQYILKTPVEVALTEAEKAAFAALYTYKPNTTITNDEGAYMAAEYVADTKIYVDGKTGSATVGGDANLVDATVE